MSFNNYYENQAGSGIQGYQAFRSQRGRGIFGTLWRNIAWPFLKYAGKKALNVGLDVGKDAAFGLPMRNSIKSRMKEHGEGIIDDISDKVKNTLRGAGIKKKRKYTSKKKNKISKKKPKRLSKKKKTVKKRVNYKKLF